MRSKAGPLVEIICLALISFLIARSGAAYLAMAHSFTTAAVLMLGAGLISLSISLRKLGRMANQLELTKRIAYLTALVLAIWAVVSPARWNVGATIAMVEVAIAFNVLTLLTAPAPKT